jgi:DNA-binding transcriptional ArsR family regulator
MESEKAVQKLSALAQEGRLAVFRLLVKAGQDGRAAGDISRKLKTRASTMSAQLLVLSNAGLIRACRDGRSIIYTVDFEAIGSLLVFLTEECCGGRPEICAPLVPVATGCCPPKKRARA